MLRYDPTVYAVGREYQIVFAAAESCIAWIECGGAEYRDSANGLMRSEGALHRVTVPMEALDGARRYEVCLRSLPERRPYFPELGPVERHAFGFRPLPAAGPFSAVMLADTHSMVEEPVRAARAAGAFDVLFLNGDIPAESKRTEDIESIFEIAGTLTHGELPVVFARGNHDLRGRFATELPGFVGTRQGDTFFTFRLGPVWGIVLDCGEDKSDDDPEYGGLVDCHGMRLAETEYIKDIIRRAGEEFAAEGITTRIALCHIPFCTQTMGDYEPKFDIEREIYAEWTRLLNAMDLDVMLSGHTHTVEAVRPGTDRMRYGANFPVVIGSRPVLPGRRPPYRKASFTGIRVSFDEGGVTVDTISDMEGLRPLARFEKGRG